MILNRLSRNCVTTAKSHREFNNQSERRSRCERWVGQVLSLLMLLTVSGFGSLQCEAFAAEGTSQETNRFNVLFIAVDDLRPELACYGVEDAQSPNLDTFAKSAMLFRNHFVQVPTCGASRYALLTGRSPLSSGVTSNNNALFGGKTALNQEQQAGAQSLPELFRRSGYSTTCIGKISHTPDGRVYAYNGTGDGRDELPHAWDKLATPFGQWKRGWGTFFAYADGLHREDGQGHRDLMQFVVQKDNELPDGLMADQAIQELELLSQGDKPFFLGLGFFKPHLPWVATEDDWAAFDDLQPPSESALSKPETQYWHGSGEFFRYKNDFEKQRPLSPQDALKARRAYLACVRYVDRQIGKVMDKLEELDLADNTIVVVWGDHGWHLGEQAIWGKHSPWDVALRSVLMIRAPGITTGGSTTEQSAETIDLYPTLVDLCQPRFQQTQWPLDGDSLVATLRGEVPAKRNPAMSFWNSAISIRFDDYRFVGQLNAKQLAAREFDAWSNTELHQADPQSGWQLVANVSQEQRAAAEKQATAELIRRSQQDEPSKLFEMENLVAWCVVPFDASARSPKERAEMLKDLNFSRLAYDWRQEHVATFEEEILQLREQGIEFFAFWDAHEAFFPLCEKYEIHPQFWKTVPSPAGETQEAKIAAAGEQLLPLVKQAQKIGCKVGLYNHGGWGGEPDNMIAVCEWLRDKTDTDSVGIVYNMHHAHDQWNGMAEKLVRLKPYLLCLNLNGMNETGNPKIVTLGQGPLDKQMIEMIEASGYQGPIGILDHRQEMDAKESLKSNLDGLKELVKTLGESPK